MASTIGQQLRHAREAKSLSIEDAAHETRIHANFIRSLEADDYSGFASITYAKSFLQLYSRYLDVDASEAIAVFRGGGAINLQGANVFTDVHETVSPLQGIPEKTHRVKRRKVRAAKPGGGPVFLGVVLGILLIAIPAFCFLGWRAESPEKIPETIAENLEKAPENFKKSFEELRKEAREKAARERELAIKNGEPDPLLKEKAEEILAASIGPAPPLVNGQTPPRIQNSENVKPTRAIPITDKPEITEEPEATGKPEVQEQVSVAPFRNPGEGNSPSRSDSSKAIPEKGKGKSIKGKSKAVSNGPPTPAPDPNAPLIARPLIARPILVNEDPDAEPIEDITPRPEKAEPEENSGEVPETGDE